LPSEGGGGNETSGWLQPSLAQTASNTTTDHDEIRVEDVYIRDTCGGEGRDGSIHDDPGRLVAGLSPPRDFAR